MLEKKDESDQRVLIAVLLCVMVFWVWSTVFSPPAVDPSQSVDPSVQVADPSQAQDPGQTPGDPSPADPSSPQLAETLPERELPVTTTELQATLSSKTGALHSVVLPRHPAALEVTPIWRAVIGLFTGKPLSEWRPYGDDPGPERLFGPSASVIAAGVGPIRPSPHLVEGEGTLTATSQQGALRVTKTLAPQGDPRLLRVTVRFENTSSAAFTGPLWVGSSDLLVLDHGSYDSVTRPAAVVDGDLETLTDPSDADQAPVQYEGPVSWLGLSDRYFLAAMIPDQPSWGQLSFNKVDEGAYGAFLLRQTTIQPGQTDQVTFDVYMGSQDLDELGALGRDLERAVDLGMFGFFARPLLFVLQLIHGAVGNWGWAIILLTLLVKGLFWPLNRASIVSGRKMQALNPKLEELRQKYKDDPQKASQEQMLLFQKEGVNPLSGCLPMLVQMPVWFALYSVLLYSSDVYHADFFYLKDLSSLDPLGLLPTLMGGLMLLQQNLTPVPPNMDPMQQRLLKLMPLMFAAFMYTFPSGLALYSLVNTFLSILQMWLINRTIPAVMPPAGAR